MDVAIFTFNSFKFKCAPWIDRRWVTGLLNLLINRLLTSLTMKLAGFIPSTADDFQPIPVPTNEKETYFCYQ